MAQAPRFPIIAPEDVPPSGFEFPLNEWSHAPASEGAGGTLVALTGKLKVKRVKIHLFVSGQLQGEFSAPCDRCGVPLTIKLSGKLSCLYSPMSSIPERTEDEDGDFPLPEGLGELAAEIDDQGEFDGAGLDARDVVREFFAIERPSSLRCEDLDPDQEASCRARWKQVGVQLSDEDVAASVEEVKKDEVGPAVKENPFSVLARLKRSH